MSHPWLPCRRLHRRWPQNGGKCNPGTLDPGEVRIETFPPLLWPPVDNWRNAFSWSRWNGISNRNGCEMNCNTSWHSGGEGQRASHLHWLSRTERRRLSSARRPRRPVWTSRRPHNSIGLPRLQGLPLRNAEDANRLRPINLISGAAAADTAAVCATSVPLTTSPASSSSRTCPGNHSSLPWAAQRARASGSSTRNSY